MKSSVYNCRFDHKSHLLCGSSTMQLPWLEALTLYIQCFSEKHGMMYLWPTANDINVHSSHILEMLLDHNLSLHSKLFNEVLDKRQTFRYNTVDDSLDHYGFWQAQLVRISSVEVKLSVSMIEAKSIMDLKNLELSNWSQFISLLWLR